MYSQVYFFCLSMLLNWIINFKSNISYAENSALTDQPGNSLSNFVTICIAPEHFTILNQQSVVVQAEEFVFPVESILRNSSFWKPRPSRSTLFSIFIRSISFVEYVGFRILKVIVSLYLWSATLKFQKVKSAESQNRHTGLLGFFPHSFSVPFGSR